MQNVEWINLFRQIPSEFQQNLVVVTRTGVELSIETVFRLEPAYAVVRGRTAGTTDTGRAFFVPYDQIDFLKIEKSLGETEMQSIFANIPAAPMPPGGAAALAGAKTPPPMPLPTAPAAPVDAKQALLERIRATRSAVMPRPSTIQPPPS